MLESGCRFLERIVREAVGVKEEVAVMVVVGVEELVALKIGVMVWVGKSVSASNPGKGFRE